MNEGQLLEWTQELIQNKGLTISKKGLALILDHIGNDLSRIDNEIDKLALNLGARKNITEDDIENYIGISKEFNVFELQSAIISKDLAKAIRIIQYFEANPKAAPIHMILPILYSFFAKVYAVHGLNGQDPKTFGLNLWPREDFDLAKRNYDINAVEKILILFHHYNLRSVGIKDGGTPEYSLMKELLVKIMN